ncbi:hypothetical protein D3C87_301130 [compost metagenome]
MFYPKEHMAKEPQELKWIEDLLPEEGYRRKPMFGGFAYYIDEKVVLVTFESLGNRVYRHKTYDFEIWNGCMFPVEKEHQDKAFKKFPFLVSHPVLPKWLYLPIETENFDELVSEVIAQVVRPQSYWGSVPKKKSKGAKPKKAAEEKISIKIDTRRPRMFSDEPAEAILSTAQKITDFKNLGAVAEAQFHKAGIKTAQQFIKLGWKKTILKLIKVNPKNRHTMYAYTLIGALTNKEWNLISEQEKQEAREYMKSLAPKKEKKSKKTKK